MCSCFAELMIVIPRKNRESISYYQDFTSLSDWTEEEPIQKKRKRQQTEDKSKELLNYLEKQWAIREESDEVCIIQMCQDLA